MEDVMNLPNTEVEYNCTLKNSFTTLFDVVTAEIHDVIDYVKENRDEYHISVYPFSIERTDGKPVPSNLLKALSVKFSLLVEIEKRQLDQTL